MTVEDLIKALKDYPPHMKVVVFDYLCNFRDIKGVDELCLCEADEEISDGHVLLIDVK